MWLKNDNGINLLSSKLLLLIYLLILILILLIKFAYLSFIPTHYAANIIRFVLAVGFLASVFTDWGDQHNIHRHPLLYLGMAILITGALVIR